MQFIAPRIKKSHHKHNFSFVIASISEAISNKLKDCHVAIAPRNDAKCSVAFTLAEILITIAIIGVVAAMTIPSLMHNAQKKIWTTSFLKAQAELTQNFKMMMAKEQVSNIFSTSVYQDSTRWCSTSIEKECDSTIQKLMDYLPGSHWDKSRTGTYGEPMCKDLNNQTPMESYCWEGRPIVLKNGNLIYIYLHSGKYEAKCSHCLAAEIDVDINGYSKPNIVGRDIFELNLMGNGLLVPPYSASYRDAVAKQYIEMGWGDLTEEQKNSFYWKVASWNGCDPKEGSVSGCSAKVFEEKKMDY